MINGIAEPRYHIKYAESNNGIDWKREGIVSIDYDSDNEAGIVKASVIVEEGKYKMWFSHRNFHNYRSDASQSYKIGYAESHDGIVWTRLGDVQFSGQFAAWELEMQCYPHVIDLRPNRYMFYNGNGFGANGFGCAKASR